MYLLFSSTKAEPIRELLKCVVTQLLQITFFVRCLSFRSCSYIRFSLVLICLTFDLTLFKWWVFSSWLEQCWSGRMEVRSLYWLVRLPLKAGSHAYALEQNNIASTSQALRLANRNVSNRDCDSISINRTALPLTPGFWQIGPCRHFPHTGI